MLLGAPSPPSSPVTATDIRGTPTPAETATASSGASAPDAAAHSHERIRVDTLAAPCDRSMIDESPRKRTTNPPLDCKRSAGLPAVWKHPPELPSLRSLNRRLTNRDREHKRMRKDTKERLGDNLCMSYTPSSILSNNDRKRIWNEFPRPRPHRGSTAQVHLRGEGPRVYTEVEVFVWPRASKQQRLLEVGRTRSLVRPSLPMLGVTLLLAGARCSCWAHGVHATGGERRRRASGTTRAMAREVG